MEYQSRDLFNEKNHSEKMKSHEILAFNNYLENTQKNFSYRHRIFKEEISEEMQFQHRFQPAVTDVLKKIIRANIGEMEEALEYILKRIGICCEVERCYIYQFYDKDKFAKNEYVWTKNIVDLSKEEFQYYLNLIKPHWVKRLHKKDYLIISDFQSKNELAKEERILLDQQGIKSLLVFPMKVEKELFGFFAFDFVSKKHKFKDYEIQSLKLLTEIIAGVFAKNIDYAKIRYFSFRDNLTGLYNRAFISEEIKRLDTKRQLPISIIMTDINNLKMFNDSFGHQKGDELIIKTADILRKTFRSEDIIARWGGDEFIIFLPKTDRNTSVKIIQRLEENCQRTYNEKLPVSLSIGLDLKTKSKKDIKEVINQADHNMYEDKIKKRRKSKSLFFTKALVKIAKNIVGKII